LVLFKPQLAVFTVAYMFVHWLVQRNWSNLGTFLIALAIVYIPSFFVCPTWIPTMLNVSSGRTGESNMLTRGASLWAWLWHGDWTLWLLPIISIIVIGLLIYVFIVQKKRAQAAQCFNLLVMPVLYASSSVTLLSILRTRRQLIILTIISWVAVLLDTFAGGFGGVYILLPITALILLARDTGQPTQPHITN
jgi:hypothetical protein